MSEVVFVSLPTVVVFFLFLYIIVKTAVKKGIKAALEEMNSEGKESIIIKKTKAHEKNSDTEN